MLSLSLLWQLVMPPLQGALSDTAIRPSLYLSVCLSQPRLQARWLPAAGRPPEMCGLRTRPRTDVDPPRVELPSTAGGGHIVSAGDNLLLLLLCNSHCTESSGAARGEGGASKGWTSQNYVICVCFHCHGTSSYHTTNALQGHRATSHVDTQTIQPGLGDFVLQTPYRPIPHFPPVTKSWRRH